MPPEARNALPDDRERLRHMLSAARDAASIVSGRTRDDLDADMPLRRALKDCVQEIGEAAARVSDEGRRRSPGLPWGSIVQMRHILVHAYYNISLDALWDVATNDLVPLIESMEAALRDWPIE